MPHGHSGMMQATRVSSWTGRSCKGQACSREIGCVWAAHRCSSRGSRSPPVVDDNGVVECCELIGVFLQNMDKMCCCACSIPGGNH